MISPPPRLRNVPALAAALVALGLGGCKRPLGEVTGLGEVIAPFERPPYLQAVDSTSAVIRWVAAPGAEDEAEIRAGGEEAPWLTVAATRARDTVRGVAGPTVTRTVRLGNLAPGTPLQYRIGAGERVLGPYTFRTAPRAADADTVRVLAFGDSGWGSVEQLRLADIMLAERLDLAIHTGDIAYQVGSETDFTLRHFQVYRALLARIPFFPSPGNHDLRTDGGAPYDRAFVFDPPFPGARFYAFRWGRVAFVSLDTTDEDVPEHEDSPVGADRPPESFERESDGAQLRDRRGRQLEWLAGQLAAARADSTVDWIIAFMHHPPYSHAEGLSAHGSDVRLGRAISPLFDRYGVDLVLSGHDHHYERTLPIRDQRRARAGCGPVYLVTGGGGASRLARGIAPGPLLAIATREHHYVRLTITATHIAGEVVGQLGQTLDAFRVLRYDGLDDEGRLVDDSCDD